jgi:hypothetical protein
MCRPSLVDVHDDCKVRFCIWVAGVERSEPPVIRDILGAANTPTPGTHRLGTRPGSLWSYGSAFADLVTAARIIQSPPNVGFLASLPGKPMSECSPPLLVS